MKWIKGRRKAGVTAVCRRWKCDPFEILELPNGGYRLWDWSKDHWYRDYQTLLKAQQAAQRITNRNHYNSR